MSHQPDSRPVDHAYYGASYPTVACTTDPRESVSISLHPRTRNPCLTRAVELRFHICCYTCLPRSQSRPDSGEDPYPHPDYPSPKSRPQKGMGSRLPSFRSRSVGLRRRLERRAES